MTDIDDRLAALEQELAVLRAQLAGRADPPPAPAAPATRDLAEEVNRRALLRKTGAAIAGAAAGGVVLAAAQASPVAAANGDAVLQGQSHTYTNTLELITTSTNQTLYLEGRTNFSTLANNGPAPLRLGQQASSTARPLGSWGNTGSLASVLRSTTGFPPADLWFAHAGTDKASGNEVWGRVHTSNNANSLQFLATPERKVNTRTGARLGDNTTTTFALAGAPSDAVGFVGTITVTDTTSNGSYVSVYNGDNATIADPQFSHINAGLGDTLATGLTVGLGASRSIKVYVFKSCHVLIDVAAWVVTGA
jgi:hypothetical protein